MYERKQNLEIFIDENGASGQQTAVGKQKARLTPSIPKNFPQTTRNAPNSANNSSNVPNKTKARISPGFWNENNNQNILNTIMNSQTNSTVNSKHYINSFERRLDQANQRKKKGDVAAKKTRQSLHEQDSEAHSSLVSDPKILSPGLERQSLHLPHSIEGSPETMKQRIVKSFLAKDDLRASKRGMNKLSFVSDDGSVGAQNGCRPEGYPRRDSNVVEQIEEELRKKDQELKGLQRMIDNFQREKNEDNAVIKSLEDKIKNFEDQLELYLEMRAKNERESKAVKPQVDSQKQREEDFHSLKQENLNLKQTIDTLNSKVQELIGNGDFSFAQGQRAASHPLDKLNTSRSSLDSEERSKFIAAMEEMQREFSEKEADLKSLLERKENEITQLRTAYVQMEEVLLKYKKNRMEDQITIHELRRKLGLSINGGSSVDDFIDENKSNLVAASLENFSIILKKAKNQNTFSSPVATSRANNSVLASLDRIPAVLEKVKGQFDNYSKNVHLN